ncbi:hypothetical protein OG562_05065 [Streptomyces sp. NBC_01275]|uniref:hypothetical protein n=1 Tax=Streptomyces sp. NBC_01275 TaxID=2903807 RepID=UPI00224EE096|nr:hypothetical protein [Streptomyces sp. NBC_01275]MCX4760361.1 hypothetical protein [Streptomyces sp. NBC_01275]
MLAVYYEMARRVDDYPRIALDIQDFFRVSSGNTRAFTAALSQRWIVLNVLDPADYFTVAK